MSAESELLRRAAAAMRERAERATPGRWKSWGMQMLADQDGTSNVDTAVPVASFMTCDDAGRPRTWDLDHAASWHPAVALAVADWLDITARILPIADDGSPLILTGSGYEAALKVAARYLGETS